MSRFRDIVRGARARETVPFPIVGVDGEKRVDLRIISADETLDALRSARARSIAKGLAEPKQGEPIYDLSLMMTTVLAAALVVGTDEPYFDSLEDVASLDPDTVQYLYQAHALFTDRCSPRLMKMSPEEFIAGIATLASEDSESVRFFERLVPGMQWTYVHTLARQAVTSQTLRSGSGSTSAASGPT